MEQFSEGRESVKVMLIVFLDIQVIVMAEWVPSRQVINQQFEVLTEVRECVRRNQPELEKWLGFAPRQRASPRFVKQFLAYNNITVLEHPPYSPDLTPCDFYLFLKIKSVLKGTHFLSIEDVKAKTAEILNSLSENDKQNCFEHWQHRTQLCVNSEGNYFEGDRS